jgi:hypothetical protein
MILNARETQVLDAIERLGEPTCTEIAHDLNTIGAHIYFQLDALERAELIRNHYDPEIDDRRYVAVPRKMTNG